LALFSLWSLVGTHSSLEEDRSLSIKRQRVFVETCVADENFPRALPLRMAALEVGLAKDHTCAVTYRLDLKY